MVNATSPTPDTPRNSLAWSDDQSWEVKKQLVDPDATYIPVREMRRGTFCWENRLEDTADIQINRQTGEITADGNPTGWCLSSKALEQLHSRDSAKPQGTAETPVDAHACETRANAEQVINDQVPWPDGETLDVIEEKGISAEIPTCDVLTEVQFRARFIVAPEASIVIQRSTGEILVDGKPSGYFAMEYLPQKAANATAAAGASTAADTATGGAPPNAGADGRSNDQAAAAGGAPKDPQAAAGSPGAAGTGNGGKDGGAGGSPESSEASEGRINWDDDIVLISDEEVPKIVITRDRFLARIKAQAGTAVQIDLPSRTIIIPDRTYRISDGIIVARIVGDDYVPLEGGSRGTTGASNGETGTADAGAEQAEQMPPFVPWTGNRLIPVRLPGGRIVDMTRILFIRRVGVHLDSLVSVETATGVIRIDGNPAPRGYRISSEWLRDHWEHLLRNAPPERRERILGADDGAEGRATTSVAPVSAAPLLDQYNSRRSGFLKLKDESPVLDNTGQTTVGGGIGLLASQLPWVQNAILAGGVITPSLMAASGAGADLAIEGINTLRGRRARESNGNALNQDWSLTIEQMLDAMQGRGIVTGETRDATREALVQMRNQDILRDCLQQTDAELINEDSEQDLVRGIHKCSTFVLSDIPSYVESANRPELTADWCFIRATRICAHARMLRDSTPAPRPTNYWRRDRQFAALTQPEFDALADHGDPEHAPNVQQVCVAYARLVVRQKEDKRSLNRFVRTTAGTSFLSMMTGNPAPVIINGIYEAVKLGLRVRRDSRAFLKINREGKLVGQDGSEELLDPRTARRSEIFYTSVALEQWKTPKDINDDHDAQDYYRQLDLCLRGPGLQGQRDAAKLAEAAQRILLRNVGRIRRPHTHMTTEERQRVQSRLETVEARIRELDTQRIQFTAQTENADREVNQRRDVARKQQTDRVQRHETELRKFQRDALVNRNEIDRLSQELKDVVARRERLTADRRRIEEQLQGEAPLKVTERRNLTDRSSALASSITDCEKIERETRRVLNQLTRTASEIAFSLETPAPGAEVADVDISEVVRLRASLEAVETRLREAQEQADRLREQLEGHEHAETVPHTLEELDNSHAFEKAFCVWVNNHLVKAPSVAEKAKNKFFGFGGVKIAVRELRNAAVCAIGGGMGGGLVGLILSGIPGLTRMVDPTGIGMYIGAGIGTYGYIKSIASRIIDGSFFRVEGPPAAAKSPEQIPPAAPSSSTPTHHH